MIALATAAPSPKEAELAHTLRPLVGRMVRIECFDGRRGRRRLIVGHLTSVGLAVTTLRTTRAPIRTYTIALSDIQAVSEETPHAAGNPTSGPNP